MRAKLFDLTRIQLRSKDCISSIRREASTIRIQASNTHSNLVEITCQPLRLNYSDPSRNSLERGRQRPSTFKCTLINQTAGTTRACNVNTDCWIQGVVWLRKFFALLPRTAHFMRSQMKDISFQLFTICKYTRRWTDIKPVEIYSYLWVSQIILVTRRDCGAVTFSDMSFFLTWKKHICIWSNWEISSFFEVA